MCVVSGTDGLPTPEHELTQSLEHDVDVPGVRGEVEDGLHVDAGADRLLGAYELGEVEPFVPRAHGDALHEAVRLVARETALHEGEQNTLAEEQVVTRGEV